jgi:branched-chain amino acid transport system substrate-binding protein
MPLSRRAFLLSSVLLPLAGCSRRSKEEPLWVGHVAPLSGPDRAAGEQQRRGIRLALDEMDKEQGIGGRQLAVVHADSRGKVEQARHEAVRLATLNKVLALMGGQDQATAEQLALALVSYAVPLLTPSLFSSSTLDGIFSLEVSPSFRGESLARFAAEQLKGRRAAVLIDESNPACAAVASAFQRHWRKGEGRTLQSWDVKAKQDPAELASRLRQAKADVLVFAGSAADFQELRRRLPDEKTPPPIIFAGESVQWQRLLAGGDTLGDFYVSSVHVPARFDNDGKEFIRRYKKEHNEEPSEAACQGYEMTRIVATALRKSKGAGGARLREELEKGEFPGLTGEFSFKQSSAVRPLFVLRTGADKPLQEYRPEG